MSKRWEVGVNIKNYKICIDREASNSMACQMLSGSKGKVHYISCIAASRESAMKKIYRYILKDVKKSEDTLRSKKKSFWEFYHSYIRED